MRGAGAVRIPARIARTVLAVATLGSGFMNLASVLGTSPFARRAVLRDIFPLEIEGWSSHLTLLLGFGLIATSVNIYKRKRRALVVAALIALLSSVIHLLKRDTYGEAAFSGALFVLLLLSKRTFTVGSALPALSHAAVRIGVFLLAVLAYAVAGFWFLDPRDFGVNFTLGNSIVRALRFLSWSGDVTIAAHTRFARWFIDSLYISGAAALLYSAFALFPPVAFRLTILPRERNRAKEILKEFGRDTLDYFKTWPDKNFFFTGSQQGFVAYRVGAGMALALGDPVGPESAIEEIIRDFSRFCAGNDWRPAFYQAQAACLPIYGRLGFHRLKIGEDALVDLRTFSTAGRGMKSVRATVSKLERAGLQLKVIDPPVPEIALNEVKAVSGEWLQMPGRRERRFSLGRFDRDYVAGTRLFTVVDTTGRTLAFANQIPSYRQGVTTIDLMRHRLDCPNGVMDFLFVKTFAWCREQGFEMFSLGMAPMSGFQERENASAAERAVHAFIQNLNFLFSFRGLRFFKAKYATSWEPRYIVYRRLADLARLTVALREVSEIR
jgi:phosphatidylglycerol lysyltransferase